MAKGKKLPPGWEKYANSKSNNIWKEKNKQRKNIWVKIFNVKKGTEYEKNIFSANRYNSWEHRI